VSVKRYYEDELAYLREIGAEFARENPKLAPFLGEASRDPDVERLLEGFAFLTARVRERIETDLPSVTQGLVSLLWPNYLRPFPAACVMQFEPAAQAVKEVRRVPKGVEIDSDPLPSGGRARFATALELDLAPVRLEHAVAERRGAKGVLTLTFRLMGDLGLDRVRIERLRICLRGADQLKLHTFQALHRRLTGVRALAGAEGEEGAESVDLGRAAVRFVGFDEGARLLDGEACEFEGFRALREYFMFADKFLFLEVDGLEALEAFGSDQAFRLQFRLSQPMEGEERVNAGAFAVNATPAVNVFPAELQPIRLDQTRTEYIVTPGAGDGAGRRLFSVTEVEGLRQGVAGRRRYTPFETFRHVADGAGEGAFYRLRLRPGRTDGAADTYISFWSTNQGDAVHDGEVISMQGLCTNADAASGLAPGRITEPTRTAPSFATFRNVTQTTRYTGAPAFDDLEWRLVSNLALNYSSFADVEALRRLLTTFNVRAKFDRAAAREHELLLAGLVETETRLVDRMHKGLPIRGFRTDLTLRQSSFASEGDLYLFACVLRRFFAEYADVNAFHMLRVRVAETNETFEWPMLQRRPTRR